MGITPDVQNQMKNAMMLQAIKAGAGGGMNPQQMSAMGQPPMSNLAAQGAVPPVDPASMQGGMNMQGMGQVPPNPVANALMSPIPGGQ